MSIKNLPSDFENWTWEKSNGQATDEQTQKAYHAIKNQGDRKEFSYLVWNDLIDKLKEVVRLSGNTWSGNDVKMSAPHQALTAADFNTTRKNIELIPTTWKWKFDKNFKGYIAREDMRAGDIVYGSYIEELVRKIVVLIDVLKDTANFAECQIILDMIAAINTNIAPLPSVPLNREIDVIAEIHSDAVALPSVPTNGQINAVAEIDAVGKVCDSAKLNANIKAKSTVNIEGMVKPSVAIGIKTKGESVSSLEAFVRRAVKLYAAVVAQSEHENTIHLCESLGILSTVHGAANYEGNITLVEILEQSADVNCQFEVEQPNINVCEKELLTMNEEMSFLPAVSVMTGFPLPVDAESHSIMIEDCDLILRPNIPLEMIAAGKSVGRLQISQNNIISLDALIEAKAEASIEFGDQWFDPIQTGTNLYIRQAYSAERIIDDLEIDTWKYPIQNGTDLYIPQMYEELKE